MLQGTLIAEGTWPARCALLLRQVRGREDLVGELVG
jgi:hypothetical protein